MTLILGRASPEFILQVADRLVSYTITGRPFYKVSNKSILFIASNAIVAMAYTGDAYLENTPTDYWIAEKLIGMKINPNDPPIFIGKQKNLQDIGLSFRNITSELDKLQQICNLDLLINFLGWQWNSKGRLRPLVGNIKKISPENTWGSEYEQRDWYINGYAMTTATPYSNISQEELSNLSNQLRQKSAPEAEILMVEKIREVSQRISIVGPHCMSILIPPPSNPYITIRYHLADDTILPKHQKIDDQQDFFAFTPWIISPDLCMPPSQIIGAGFTSHTSIFTINFSTKPQGNSRFVVAHEGQKRSRKP